MSKPLLPASLALMLMGCASARPPSLPPTLPSPPADALLSCDPLPPMFSTAGQAVAWVDSVAGLYVRCDAKRRELAEAWPR